MIRNLQQRVFYNMQNYVPPNNVEISATGLRVFEILNKKAAPKKKLTLSQKKAYKILNAPKKTSTEVLNLCRTLLGIQVKLKDE